MPAYVINNKGTLEGVNLSPSPSSSSSSFCCTCTLFSLLLLRFLGVLYYTTNNVGPFSPENERPRGGGSLLCVLCVVALNSLLSSLPPPPRFEKKMRGCADWIDVDKLWLMWGCSFVGHPFFLEHIRERERKRRSGWSVFEEVSLRGNRSSRNSFQR